jgi:spermidine synthase
LQIGLTSGLGVGIAANTLTNAGVLVDLVEIDPVVVDYAQRYFDLATMNSIHTTDGRAFLNEAQAGTYDFVIHDVFSNGGVPASLFSVEAMQEVKRVMVDDGILALVRSYATGHVGDDQLTNASLSLSRLELCGTTALQFNLYCHPHTENSVPIRGMLSRNSNKRGRRVVKVLQYGKFKYSYLMAHSGPTF